MLFLTTFLHWLWYITYCTYSCLFQTSKTWHSQPLKLIFKDKSFSFFPPKWKYLSYIVAHLDSLQAVFFSISLNVKCLLRQRWMHFNSWAELLSQFISTSTHRWVCSQTSEAGWRMCVSNRVCQKKHYLLLRRLQLDFYEIYLPRS